MNAPRRQNRYSYRYIATGIHVRVPVYSSNGTQVLVPCLRYAFVVVLCVIFASGFHNADAVFGFWPSPAREADFVFASAKPTLLPWRGQQQRQNASKSGGSSGSSTNAAAAAVRIVDAPRWHPLCRVHANEKKIVPRGSDIRNWKERGRSSVKRSLTPNTLFAFLRVLNALQIADLSKAHQGAVRLRLG